MYRSTRGLAHVVAALVIASLPFSAAVHAADKSAGSAEHGHKASESKSGMSGSSIEMHSSMMKGMKEMQGMKPSGNMNRDFAMMMRHHHTMGIKMAQHELQYGKDERMREMLDRRSRSKQIR